MVFYLAGQANVVRLNPGGTNIKGRVNIDHLFTFNNILCAFEANLFLIFAAKHCSKFVDAQTKEERWKVGQVIYLTTSHHMLDNSQEC
jgi:hypothetical protein